MPDTVPIRQAVQVRLKVSAGNWLWMNLDWYNFCVMLKIGVDQLVPGVYFVANG
jgi:hypothetical protein